MDEEKRLKEIKKKSAEATDGKAQKRKENIKKRKKKVKKEEKRNHKMEIKQEKRKCREKPKVFLFNGTSTRHGSFNVDIFFSCELWYFFFYTNYVFQVLFSFISLSMKFYC